MADSLDEVSYLQQQQPSDILKVVTEVIEALLKGNLRHITLEGTGGITSGALANSIAPYLQALNGYLEVYAEIQGKPFKELRIIQIHNIEAKIELGVGDTIRALDDLLNRRKRGDEGRLREVEIQIKGLEKTLLQRENEQKYAQMALEKPIREAEVSARLEEIKTNAIKSQIELRRELLELEKLEEEFLRQKRMSYLEEASAFIEKMAPQLSFEEHFSYIMRLASHLQHMDETDLKLRLGYHDNPRPSTLPGLPKPPEKS